MTQRKAKRGREVGHEHLILSRPRRPSKRSGVPVIPPNQRGCILRGDSAHVLRSVASDSVDALVTDPPAGIGLYGLAWDSDRGGQDAWCAWLADILREAVRAMKPGAHGFIWAYPKTAHWTMRACELAGLEIRDVAVHLFGYRMPRGVDIAKAIDAKLGVEPRVVGSRTSSKIDLGQGKRRPVRRVIQITEPTSKLARQWQGWTTSLKPASEHWILVRKPVTCRLVDNVLELGTGAINVGACTVDGRLPSSVIVGHDDLCSVDCTDRCPAGLLGERARFFYAHRPSTTELEAGCESLGRRRASAALGLQGRLNQHPTPKPLSLMRWLVRLITPKGGLVLDPFAGSGSTGAAAMLEGATFLGIERDEASVRVARARLAYWKRKAGLR